MTPESNHEIATRTETLWADIATHEDTWEAMRSEYFDTTRINLNPGTMGTPSRPVRIAKSLHDDVELDAFPLDQYEAAHEGLRRSVALCNLLWPTPDHRLVITSGTTHTMSALLQPLVASLDAAPDDIRVLTTLHESSHGVPELENNAFQLRYLEDDILGDLDELEGIATDFQPDIFFLSQVLYDTGEVLPVEAMTTAVKKANPEALVIVDVSQSIGLYPLPFHGADALVGSAHKWLFGPKGLGFLWVTPTLAERLGDLHLSKEDLNEDPVRGFGIPGGHDFSQYMGLEAALLLLKQMGPATALERSSHLGEWLAPRFIEILNKHGIAATCLTAGPIVSIELGAFGASELSEFLNGVGIHIKWISNTLSNGKQQNILRIGLPYYETKARLRVVLALIDDFLE